MASTLLPTLQLERIGRPERASSTACGEKFDGRRLSSKKVIIPKTGCWPKSIKLSFRARRLAPDPPSCWASTIGTWAESTSSGMSDAASGVGAPAVQLGGIGGADFRLNRARPPAGGALVIDPERPPDRGRRADAAPRSDRQVWHERREPVQRTHDFLLAAADTVAQRTAELICEH